MSISSDSPPHRDSWLPIPADSHFGIANIPFGIISTPADPTPRPAIAIGTRALDLAIFTANAGFSALPSFTDTFVFTTESTLNAFASLGRLTHSAVRSYLQEIFDADTPFPERLKDNTALQAICLHDLDTVTMHLPMNIGDYSDFYAGRNHAYNVGVLFRGRENALQKNYEMMPIGYHGRASSVVVSGTPIRRPKGQVADGDGSVVVPTRKLDYELELAAFIGRDSTMGESVGIDDAEEYLFGVVLMNDWSARDIQAFEYVPLGPFTAKSFATSISPWVVLLDALAPFRTAPLQRITTRPLHQYLCESETNSIYNINLTVTLTTPEGEANELCRTSSKNLLWSFSQMVAQHTVTGCPLRTGDLIGTGTISGLGAGELGSLLEKTEGGKVPVKVGEGERVQLGDGDEVVIEGWCGKGVGFGRVAGKVLRA